MDDLERLKKDVDKLLPKAKLQEGRVFRNTGEMIRSIITDVRRVQTDIVDGMADINDVEEDLNDIIHYYMDAEISNTPRY